MKRPETPAPAFLTFFCAYLVVAVLFFFYGCTKPPKVLPGPVLEKVNGLNTDVDQGREENREIKPPGGGRLRYAKTPRFPVIYFEFDADTVGTDYQDTLSRIARTLRADWICNVDGHASSEGTDEYNLALGARRASRVGDYLQAFKGITVVETSYGEERLADGPPERSRRVEVSCR